jgi:hypothetical protein
VITVDAVELLGMLEDMNRTRGNDTSLPMLMGIILHVDGGKLYASSTDRYVLGQCLTELAPNRDDAPTAWPGRIVLGPEAAQLARTALVYAGPARPAQLVADGTNLVLSVGSWHGHTDLCLPLMEVEPPRMGQIFASLADHRASDAGEAVLSPAFVSKLVQIGKRRRERMRFTFGREGRVTSVDFGPRCRVLIMPVRDEVAAPFVHSAPEGAS